MRPMATLRSAALIGLVAVFVAGTARAQHEPAPVAPPPTAPPASPPASAPDPNAPPATAPPPSAPVTPAPGTSPVSPLSPTLAPELAPAPPLTLEQRPTAVQPRPDPFYKQTWFWVGLGVVATVVVMV